MRGELYNISVGGIQKKIRRTKCLCAMLVAVILGLHILFLCIRTEHNHSLMLWLNIMADTFGGWILINLYFSRITLLKQFYLFAKKSEYQVIGTVEWVSERTVRHRQLDCYEVFINGKKYFAPADFIKLEPTFTVKISVTSGVIVEVAYE